LDGGEGAGELASVGSSVRAISGWFRHETSGKAVTSARADVAGAAGGSAVERLLVGRGPMGAEVRLQIGAGPWSGAQIHLVERPGGIELRLLTHHEDSRQTLALAMDEVAERLRGKGIDLRANDAGRPSRRRFGPDRAPPEAT